MQEFSILKAFNIAAKPCMAPITKQVLWIAPPGNWIKCNTDGAAKGAPDYASCGGIVRDKSGAALGCFGINLGVTFALHAELVGSMTAIEIAYTKGWHNLCLECDSHRVILALKSPTIVPWKLRNRWNNCLELTRSMCFISSHIFREGNSCTNKIASFSFYFVGFHWWETIPRFISEDFYHNRVGLPYYRFK